ncbi:MAG: exo-alpha-sialidase, partial [Kiritimatiellae bacterium]|nr:exo-alpha-sialidase [Kiritimatiellia bacterium]
MKSALPGIAAMLALAPLASTYAAKVTSQKYDVRVVQDVDGYNSWQMIQALGARLVCAYSRGSAHTIHEGKRDVFARFSDDGGRTWSTEISV